MKNKQAGGIVSFIIVTVALAGLLIGGLYLSKTQGRAARENDTSTPQVAAPAKGHIPEEKPAEGPKPSPAPATPSQQPQGATTPKPAPQPQTSSSSTARTPQNRVAATGPSDAIPATGPTENVMTVIALSILAYASYRFIAAKRSRRSSALSR